MREPETIRVSSAEIGTAFAQWVERMRGAEVRLVTLEGMLNSGKTRLTQQPFAVEADRFLCHPVEPQTPYCEAVDQRALRSALLRALDVYPLVVVEGAIVWPLVLPLPIERVRVRRVYLKRMMHLQPDVWQDERAIIFQDPPPQASLRGPSSAIITTSARGGPPILCSNGSSLPHDARHCAHLLHGRW